MKKSKCDPDVNYIFSVKPFTTAFKMAMMDNKAFLISHVRNSFITSDDTGMCEMIIEVEDLEKKR